jgi:membrane protein DedA with SNARE-associated domain
MAGIARMPWLTFLKWNALGGIVWATAYGLLAYFIGHAAQRILEKVGLVGVIVFVAGLVAIGIWRFRVERRRLAALIATAPDPDADAAEHP